MPRISVFITSLLFPSCRVLSAEAALSRLKDFSLSLYTNVAHEGVSLSSSSPAPSERHLLPALTVLHEKPLSLVELQMGTGWTALPAHVDFPATSARSSSDVHRTPLMG